MFMPSVSQRPSPRRAPARGFTLVELIVVIGIIGLLVGVLIPSLGEVRDRAKRTATTAEFKSIEGGLEAYKGEAGLESTYPPSRSDIVDGGVFKIANWFKTASIADVPTCGAVLLMYALVGADRQGTPGFRDWNRNGTWADDIHSGAGGAYERNTTTGDPVRARYGGSGYVDSNLLARVKTFEDLRRLETIRGDTMGSAGGDAVPPPNTATTWMPIPRQTVFTDAYDRPILYYRANIAARQMMQPFIAGGGLGGALGGIAVDRGPGIYNPRDNALITGVDGGGTTYQGINLGGKLPNTTPDRYHRIARVEPNPPAIPEYDSMGNNMILTDDTKYLDHFARYVLDPSVKTKNTPVRKDSFLLISAGKDGIYGTKDDITNWTRN